LNTVAVPAAALLWGHPICVHLLKHKINKFMIYWITLSLISTILDILIFGSFLFIFTSGPPPLELTDFAVLCVISLVIGIVAGLVGAVTRHLLRKLIGSERSVAQAGET
jgi:hypothetical protein